MFRKALVLVPLLVAGVAMAGSTPTSTTPAPAAPPSASPAATVTAPPPSAAPRPEDVIGYRQTVMHAAGNHLKLIGMVAKGQSDRAQDVLPNAVALHETAMELGNLFPAGTGPDKFPPSNDRNKTSTDALPELWSKSTDFQTAVKNYQDASQKLVDAATAKDPAAIKAAWSKVGDSCGDCHDKFRVKD